MHRAKLAGAVLATAVGLMFLAQTGMAQDQPQSNQPQVKCMGGNSCKGLSSCKTATNSCKGQNACKGKGYVMTSSVEECTKDGGHVDKQ